MDFIFISMPYAKFDSRWFAHVPNINLGILNALLSEKGKQAKTFHFHLDFLSHLRGFDAGVGDKMVGLAAQFGVEYLGLDYVFGSLLFEDRYQASRELFRERLSSVGFTLNDFDEFREVARSFIELAYSRVEPYLEETRLVGFSCSHYQLSASLLMCSKIKEAYPEVYTVVGGKDCSGAFANELLDHMDCVDYVGIGECEVTICSLLEHMDDSKKPLCNVMYRDATGKIKKSKSRPNFSPDSLPFPKYDFEEMGLEPSEVILPVELGRGCPWGKCTFCPDESYNIQCGSKSAKRVNEEIEYYQGVSSDLTNFIILDSDALKDPEEVVELSKYLEGKELSFHFAEFRAQRLDKKVLEALLRFGNWVSPFQVGIEIFCDRVLGLMKKGVTALRNVELLKMVAELGIPLQFNLFTCYPNMTSDDFLENLKVMDLITHLLVRDNISMFPGEFYLPTDCPVFLDMGRYGLEKHTQSMFSDIFEDFPMPSYSNYVYSYQFDNDEEQFKMSMKIREKAAEIESKGPRLNHMYYENATDGLRIAVCRDGQRTNYELKGSEEDIYLAAIEESQRISTASENLGISSADVRSVLDDFEQKGLILYSSDKKSFLSLAMKT